MSIEGLEVLKKDLWNSYGTGDIGLYLLHFMDEAIDTLKVQSDRIADIEQRLAQGEESTIADLQKRVKRLEQQGSYYPTVEEISSIKVGGTDD